MFSKLMLLTSVLAVTLMVSCVRGDEDGTTNKDNENAEAKDEVNGAEIVEFAESLNSVLDTIKQIAKPKNRRDLQRRGWWSDTWQSVKPALVSAAVGAVLGKRAEEEQVTTAINKRSLNKRGWFKNALGAAAVAAVLGKRAEDQ